MYRAVVWLLMLFSSCSFAETFDTFEFDDPQMQQRFVDLTKQLRCPKCQNQNLSDSNSPIATDLRRAVYKQLIQGKNDQQIQTFMVQRYGEFVLYEPKLKSSTYVLWYGPAGLLMVGALFGIRIFKRRKNHFWASPTDNPSEQTIDHQPLSRTWRIGLGSFIFGFSALVYQQLGAFELANRYVDPKAQMLSEQAQYLYDTHGQKMTLQIRSLIDQALSIDPEDPTTHVLLGMHYFADEQYRLAIGHWQRVLDSPRADIDKEALQMAIDEANGRMR